MSVATHQAAIAAAIRGFVSATRRHQDAADALATMRESSFDAEQSVGEESAAAAAMRARTLHHAEESARRARVAYDLAAEHAAVVLCSMHGVNVDDGGPSLAQLLEVSAKFAAAGQR